jgi:hypothetical protein
VDGSNRGPVQQTEGEAVTKKYRSWKDRFRRLPEVSSDPKYTLLLGTPPEDLEPSELAALMALTAQLTKLSKLPGFDPTDVTITMAFGRTGHVGCAKMELAGTDPGKSPVQP